ncbi:nitroreductase [Dyella sp. C11]|uniref:nitroreductase family protein n=1 Tax=Dyella sp. C11 TaxID=2126991 RepID=UPI000D64BE8F|nr:nitroreductase [Dyella sp. C11]
MSHPLSLLEQRHSVPSRQLGAPGPDAATLKAMLEASIRVPDHGKLEPFRLLLIQGDDKLAFGQKLAELSLRVNPHMTDSKREKDRTRYDFAPLVVVVIARTDDESKVPVIEQQLTAGCVAYNLLLAAEAMGFGAQWLTGWAAYDREAAAIMGLKDNEQVIGFVHIGTSQIDVPDRERPRLADVVSTWTP